MPWQQESVFCVNVSFLCCAVGQKTLFQKFILFCLSSDSLRISLDIIKGEMNIESSDVGQDIIGSVRLTQRVKKDKVRSD